MPGHRHLHGHGRQHDADHHRRRVEDRLPPLTAALAFPGARANVELQRVALRRSTGATRGLSDAPGAPTGSGPAVYGIAVNGSLPALAAQVENALAEGRENDVRGKDETDESATTQGANTIRPDDTLTSRAVSGFVAAMRIVGRRRHQRRAPARRTRSATSDPRARSDLKSSACWGTTAHPKIVYVRGAPPTGDVPRPSLNVTGESTGTGVLIVEDGTVEIGGNFTWNGPIILAGRDVAIRFRGAGQPVSVRRASS